MVNYKLYYFNVTGLAEPIRYMLHYCGIKFDDIRFNDFEEWKIKYKKGNLYFLFFIITEYL
jgi:glutathione S-transferase